VHNPVLRELLFIMLAVVELVVQEALVVQVG
jgi:hypothetical protein